MKLNNLKGKVALVTGAAGVIGSGIVRRMVQEGIQVVAVDIDTDQLEEKFARDDPSRIKTYDVDLTNEDEVSHLADNVIKTFSKVDFLINVAGGELKPNRAYPDIVVSRGMHSIESIDFQTFIRTIHINLTTAFLCCRAFIPQMKRLGGGRIINFTSFATRHGSIHVGAHYAAAKGGIVGLTKTLALELAPYNITVNSIAPGLIPHGEIKREALLETVSKIPLGRTGTPDDIASVIAVLCSEAGAYTTGLTLDVNGGLYIAP